MFSHVVHLYSQTGCSLKRFSWLVKCLTVFSVGPFSDIRQHRPIHLRPWRHQAVNSTGAVWWGAQEPWWQAQSKGWPKHSGVRRPWDSKVTVPQVRGKDGPASSVHHWPGSLRCWSDGICPEKPRLQRVDAGSRSSGSGWQRSLSHRWVWQGGCFQWKSGGFQW